MGASALELSDVKRIEGGLVFTGERFHAADVVIGGDRFSAVVASSDGALMAARDPAVLDATGRPVRRHRGVAAHDRGL